MRQRDHYYDGQTVRIPIPTPCHASGNASRETFSVSRSRPGKCRPPARAQRRR